MKDTPLYGSTLTAAVLALAAIGATGPAGSADLGGADTPQVMEPVADANPWTFRFTMYSWLPWMTGDAVVRGRGLDVDVSPDDILRSLDWSTLPVWMSYAEARRGPVSFFNDIVYSKISGSGDFAKATNRRIVNASLAGSVEADYEQATIELGGAYEIWSGGSPSVPGSSAVDLLGGARYWHQELDVSADLTATLTASGGPLGIVDLQRSGNRVFAKSDSVDWVDPFIGARLRHQLAPGQEIVVRGDVGGFDVGSEFSWQAMATYNWELCTTGGHILEGYVGYRALSVDYSQGSGKTRYEYDVLQQGPVLGATLRF